MTRALLSLNSLATREKAVKWIALAPDGTRVEFKKPRRSLPQNDRFWAMLTDIASQCEWYGKRMTTDDWKVLFIDGVAKETRIVPSINGGFVSLGRSSSDLSKEEMTNLIDFIHAFGAERGVVFHD